MLAFVQAWSNLVFFAVICFNLSGIVTELQAKHMVDKLNLMTKKGSKSSVLVRRVALVRRVGSQEMSFVCLLGSRFLVILWFWKDLREVNEAMLTGESDSGAKVNALAFYPGSF